MVKVHEGAKIYIVTLRAVYSHIRSEKAFRDLVESGIKQWEIKSPAYGNALRSKSIWEVCSIFGIISFKHQINK